MFRRRDALLIVAIYWLARAAWSISNAVSYIIRKANVFKSYK